MEQEKSFKFKLFVPPKPSTTQISAVKPQTNRRDEGFFQNFNNRTEDVYNLPFEKRTTSKHIDLADPDSQRVKLVPEIHQENLETRNELYSKLYKEAEKIKRWKVTVEYELKEKERILQENRKITEALRKAIQELQFENEKLSLKLEDEIHENKDLLKENSATRHLCNLLKEKFMQSMEKVNKYEHEQEETRQMYVDLNNNIEGVVQIFSLFFSSPLPGSGGERVELDLPIVSVLATQLDDKDNKMKHINNQLQSSRELTAELEETRKQQQNILKKAQSKEQDLLTELEEMKCSLLKKETATLVSIDMSTDGGKGYMVPKLKESSINVGKDLKHQLECAQSECMLLIKEKETRNSDDTTLQVQVQELLDEKHILEKTVEKLQEREKELKDTVQIKEKEIHSLEMQLSGALENKEDCLQQLTLMKAELEKEILNNEQLRMDWNKVLLGKEQIIQEKNNMANEFRKLQEDLKDKNDMREEAEKQIENLKETNRDLRNELECLKEKMKSNYEETKCKIDESKANAKHIENEISKKEKQLKTLENKINSLRKQTETKSKIVQDLQQENKVLRKKIAAESKQTSITEGKVNKLQSELENINKLHQETIDSYKNETEMARAAEENLVKELQAMKLAADEAVNMQKEIDIRCQHKITEMVSLMEKHKRQYDKTVEEKDTELESYRTKQQALTSTIGSLEKELSSMKNEIFSLQEQLKTAREEKESLAKEAEKSDVCKSEKKHKKTQTSVLETPKDSSLASLATSKKNTPQSITPIKKIEQTKKSSWTPAKTYTVKTPPKSKLLRESTNLLSEERRKKKRKVLLEMDSHSDNSDNNDLLVL
ncbi:hypothetical protein JRQ81_013991 [Phrynocephalus forsythii]|uniref:Synaptonemal complex protein 1 n=1 Tax=Phrynocephalus forsythii TaxID=171643 RepID=A0A9Q0XWS2_9SAUR|nr:hypothetical protein JRQ81_013991 [Phrynocephalus forsythii]